MELYVFNVNCISLICTMLSKLFFHYVHFVTTAVISISISNMSVLFLYGKYIYAFIVR